MAKGSSERKRKPQTKRPENDPVEYKRFLEVARKVEASEDASKFDRAFEKVTRTRRGD